MLTFAPIQQEDSVQGYRCKAKGGFMNLTEFHSKFPGSVRWRLTVKGVEVEGQGLVQFREAMLVRAKDLMSKHAEAFAAASQEFGVPIELLMACALTEAAVRNPETSVRKEPGYVSDAKTPGRISAGLC